MAIEGRQKHDSGNCSDFRGVRRITANHRPRSTGRAQCSTMPLPLMRGAMIKDFKEFLMKNAVLALAIAFVMGAATQKVVSSIVADIIMPLISLILPNGEWRSARIILSSGVGADGKEVVNAINYGNFFGNLMDLIIIALIVFLITKALIKQAPAPPSKKCPRCTETIAIDATKCKYCTTDI
ncbi:MAG: large conductance mechanosensitive channel protein MscL [Acidobacteria bacterium]|nr:MAG: large conductance mechanosensitive channel protein MscL [Acidobacteriota bacterium]